MTGDDIRRLNYYERQYLGVRDFKDEQAYQIGMRRRHAIAHHMWGIVAGLKLNQIDKEGSPGEVEIFVEPGMAVDGFGREIILLTSQKIDPTLFNSFKDDKAYEVWISYDESIADPPANGYGSCDVADQFGRVVESFRIHVGPTNDLHDPIEVDGATVVPPAIPYDESVPYQELPAVGAASDWLVRLGSVHWNGTKLISATKIQLAEGRRYIGSIAEEIAAPNAKLLIRDRSIASPISNDVNVKGVKVTLEGTLDVERKLSANKDAEVKENLIVDGKLGVGTNDPKVKTQIMGGTDTSFAAASGYLVMGDTAGKNVVVDDKSIMARSNGGAATLNLQGLGGDLTIYAKNPSAEKRIVVKEGGNVGIGTIDPKGRLHIATGDDMTVSNGKGYIVLGKVEEENIAIDKNEIMARTNGTSSTLHLQAEGGDMLLHHYNDGTEFTVKNNGDVGIGTKVPAQRLDVHGRIVRHGQAFSQGGTVKSGELVTVPFGTNVDWNIFVSPNHVGERELFLEHNNALLQFDCYAEVVSLFSWRVWVKYVYRKTELDFTATENTVDGIANYILIPR